MITKKREKEKSQYWCLLVRHWCDKRRKDI